MYHIDLHGNKLFPSFFYSQTGEGTSEEGCGADEGEEPQLSSWSCGLTGEHVVHVFVLLHLFVM